MDINEVRNNLIIECSEQNVKPSIITNLQRANSHDALIRSLLFSMAEVSRKINLTAEKLKAYFPVELLEANRIFVGKQEHPVQINRSEIGYFYGDAQGIIGEKVCNLENSYTMNKAYGYFFEHSSGDIFGNSSAVGYDNSHLNAHDNSMCKANNQTSFIIDGNAQLSAKDQSRGKACQQSTVMAVKNSFLELVTDKSVVYLFGESAGIFQAESCGILVGKSTCLQIGYNTQIDLDDNTLCLSLQGGKTVCQGHSKVFSDNLQNIDCIDKNSRANLMNLEYLKEIALNYTNGNRHVIEQMATAYEKQNLQIGYHR